MHTVTSLQMALIKHKHAAFQDSLGQIFTTSQNGRTAGFLARAPSLRCKLEAPMSRQP